MPRRIVNGEEEADARAHLAPGDVVMVHATFLRACAETPDMVQVKMPGASGAQHVRTVPIGAVARP